MRWIAHTAGLTAFLLSLTLLFESWPLGAEAASDTLEIAAASEPSR